MPLTRFPREARRPAGVGQAAIHCGLVALLAVPVAGFAGPSGSGAYDLRMKFKQGEIRKYQTSVQMSLASMAPSGKPTGGKAAPTGIPIQAINALEQYKVVKTLPDGGAQVAITTLSGQTAAGPLQRGAQPMVMTFDARGKLKAIRGLEGGAGGAIMGNMFGSSSLGGQGASLPPHPVKVGDQWTEPLTVPNVGIGKVKGMFVKTEQVGRYKTALLHYVLTVPVNTYMDATMQPTAKASEAKMTATGVLNMTFDNDFAIAEGKLVRTSGSGTINMTLTMKGKSPQKLPVQIAVGTMLAE